MDAWSQILPATMRLWLVLERRQETRAAITGPVGSGTSCANWTTGGLTAYGRRCHLLTGLTAGDTIQFRWRFTSDGGAEFAGFYLDDIAATNILLPNFCNPAPTATPTATATATA